MPTRLARLALLIGLMVTFLWSSLGPSYYAIIDTIYDAIYFGEFLLIQCRQHVLVTSLTPFINWPLMMITSPLLPLLDPFLNEIKLLQLKILQKLEKFDLAIYVLSLFFQAGVKTRTWVRYVLKWIWEEKWVNYCEFAVAIFVLDSTCRWLDFIIWLVALPIWAVWIVFRFIRGSGH